MLKKIKKISIALIVIILITTIAGIIFRIYKSSTGEIKPMKIDVSGSGANLVFNFSINRYIAQYNLYYRKDNNKDYLPSANGTNSYNFKEDEKIITFPELAITTDGYSDKVRRITIAFDWHSYSKPILDKHGMMCYYALRTVFQDLSNDEIRKLYSKAMDIGYENPRDEWYNFDSAVPYALFYKGNVGVYTYFALGQSEYFCIIPITEDVITNYSNKGVHIFKLDR